MSSTYVDNDDIITITLIPTFSLIDDNFEDYRTLFWGQLPNNIKYEVLKYFESSKFILDQVENYALDTIKNQCSTINLKILSMNFYESDNNDILYIKFTCHVHKVDDKYCNSLVTIYDIEDNIREGFYKASHSGPLVDNFGNYLGDDNGKYQIYFEYDDISVRLNPNY
jgi:hypothetical protein